MAAGLTNKQRIFVEYYLQTWNATDSARRGGYKHPNMAGPRLMVKDSIKAGIAARMKEVAMDTDEALARLAEMARASISDFVFESTETVVDKDGRASEIKTVGINWEAVKQRGHLLKAVKPTTAGITLEMIDNQAALRDVLKHHGQLKESADPIDLNITVSLKNDDE